MVASGPASLQKDTAFGVSCATNKPEHGQARGCTPRLFYLPATSGVSVVDVGNLGDQCVVAASELTLGKCSWLGYCACVSVCALENWGTTPLEQR